MCGSAAVDAAISGSGVGMKDHPHSSDETKSDSSGLSDALSVAGSSRAPSPISGRQSPLHMLKGGKEMSARVVRLLGVFGSPLARRKVQVLPGPAGRRVDVMVETPLGMEKMKKMQINHARDRDPFGRGAGELVELSSLGRRAGELVEISSQKLNLPLPGHQASPINLRP